MKREYYSDSITNFRAGFGVRSCFLHSIPKNLFSVSLTNSPLSQPRQKALCETMLLTGLINITLSVIISTIARNCYPSLILNFFPSTRVKQRGARSCFLHQGYPNAAIPIPHKFPGISTIIALSVSYMY